MRVALAGKRGRRRFEAAAAQSLQFALYTNEEPATWIIIREWLVRPLQVGMLCLVGQVLHRNDDADMAVEIITGLRIELPIGRREDLVHLAAEGEGRAHLRVIERLVTIRVRTADGESVVFVVKRTRQRILGYAGNGPARREA